MSDDRRGEWNDQYVAEQDEALQDIENDLDAFSFFVVDYDMEGEEEEEDWEDWEEWWDDDHGESLDLGLDED